MTQLHERGAERARIEIYTWQYCAYCLAAKRLLQKKGVDYQEYPIDNDDEAREQMAERARGRRTLPQIFIDGRHIGGYTDLAQLDQAGGLDALLGAPPRGRARE